MSATLTAQTRPAPTYPKYHRPCWRCGIIRECRTGTNVCIDCRPYAKDFERES